MQIPGSNILNTALRAIARQTFQYYTYASRTLQSNGQYLTNYNPPVTCTGSVQPFPRDKYEAFGLDFEKRYFNFFISRNALDLTRNVTSDQIVFACKTYQVISKTPWYAIDGWDEILAAEIS